MLRSSQLHLVLLLATVFAGPTLADTNPPNAASGNLVQGREELRLAQELAPGLPFVSIGSVQELQDKLSGKPLVHTPPARQTAAGFPWSMLTVFGVGMGVLLALVDRYAQPREVRPPAVNAPLTGEIAQERHASDHLGSPDLGVSGASSWDDGDHDSLPRVTTR